MGGVPSITRACCHAACRAGRTPGAVVSRCALGAATDPWPFVPLPPSKRAGQGGDFVAWWWDLFGEASITVPCVPYLNQSGESEASEGLPGLLRNTPLPTACIHEKS